MVVADKQTPIASAAPAKPASGGHRRWWRTAVELPIYLAAAVLVLEGFFTLAGVGFEEILQPDPQFGTKHIANKRVVWRMEGFSNETLNSIGLRDTEHAVAKPANTYRVALLGDSATEGLQVPLPSTYGCQIQQLFKKQGLNTEVINFACSGYSTGQEVLEYEKRVAQYKPDLTILLYNRGDAVENTRKPTDLAGEPRPYFFMGPDGSLQQDDRVLAANAKALQPNRTMQFLRENSRIYGVLSQANLMLSIHEPLYRKLRGWVLTPFTPRKPKLKPSEAPYPQQDAWKVTQALIERLNDDCQHSGSKLVVVAFPNVVDDPEFGQQIKSLDACAKAHSFGFFDLTPTFRWNPDPMSLFLQYHFSAKGHRVVAEKITEYLKKSL